MYGDQAWVDSLLELELLELADDSDDLLPELVELELDCELEELELLLLAELADDLEPDDELCELEKDSVSPELDEDDRLDSLAALDEDWEELEELGMMVLLTRGFLKKPRATSAARSG